MTTDTDPTTLTERELDQEIQRLVLKGARHEATAQDAARLNELRACRDVVRKAIKRW